MISVEHLNFAEVCDLAKIVDEGFIDAAEMSIPAVRRDMTHLVLVNVMWASMELQSMKSRAFSGFSVSTPQYARCAPGC